MRHSRQVLLAFVVTCGLAIAGELVNAADGKVSGTVTVDVKPLAAGKVFLHLEGGQFVGAKIKDGKFVIDRVPVGTRKVTLEGTGVPAKCAEEETSDLLVTIEEGGKTLEFNLVN